MRIPTSVYLRASITLFPIQSLYCHDHFDPRKQPPPLHDHLSKPNTETFPSHKL